MPKRRKNGIIGPLLFGLGAGTLYSVIRSTNERRQSNSKLKNNILNFNDFVQKYQQSLANHIDFLYLDRYIEQNIPNKNYNEIIQYIDKEIEINKLNELITKELWYKPIDITTQVDLRGKIMNRVGVITRSMSEFPIAMSSYLWIRNKSLESTKKIFIELNEKNAEFVGEYIESYKDAKEAMAEYEPEVKRPLVKFEKNIIKLLALTSNL